MGKVVLWRLVRPQGMRMTSLLRVIIVLHQLLIKEIHLTRMR